MLGSEPQIYFYSGRRSATGYLYMYGLMEDQKYALRMQQEMIGEIETNSPEFVVFVHIPSSWARPLDSETLIFKWADHIPDEPIRLGRDCRNLRLGPIGISLGGGRPILYAPLTKHDRILKRK